MHLDTEFLAGLLIRTADEEILPRYAEVESRIKTDGTVVTDADINAQDAIQRALQGIYPGIPCLSEEMSAEIQRSVHSDADAYWCLDPLDGTSNFAAGLPFFSISLSLIEHGSPVFGMIYDPVRRDMFSAYRGRGAVCNGRSLRLNTAESELKGCLAIVDFKRLPPNLAAALAVQPPFRSQRNCGSVALEWCWVASGRFQLYVHGGQRLWDYAAGYLIFSEAGGLAEIAGTFGSAPKSRFDLDSAAVVAAANEKLFHPWREWVISQCSGAISSPLN